jgi:hypothetical protein
MIGSSDVHVADDRGGRLKVLRSVLSLLLFVGAASAYGEEAGGRLTAFDDSIRVFRNIFTQSSAQDGKGGIRVSCTLLPQEEVAVVAWKIENPGGNLLTISADNVKFYSDSEPFEMIDTKEAMRLYYRWTTEHDSSGTREAFQEIHNMPGEDAEESAVYDAEFRFGSSSDSVICGFTYFACRMKHVAAVTAEMRIDDQTFSFAFDGDGP